MTHDPMQDAVDDAGETTQIDELEALRAELEQLKAQSLIERADLENQRKRLAREIVSQKLGVKANCAARTVIADIKPVAEISQRTGLAIECCTFIGSSPVRQYAEGWTIDQLLRLTDEAITFAVGEGLAVMYVTEDTTRADPDTLRRLYSTAIRAGASRVCVSDTVGHATPDGAALARRCVDRSACSSRARAGR